MKQPVRHRPKYRLSPNEVEQLKKEETEKRRKLRIVQVRQQAKAAAARIRNDVKQEKDRQLLKLAKEVESQLEDEKQEEVRKLEQQYENTLRTIGQAHSQAQITDKNISHAEQQQTALENKRIAEARHREALRKLAVEKAYKEYEETKHFRDRQAALEEEKKRAAEVAARPPPPPDLVAAMVDEKSKISKPIPLTDVNAFSTTHYHIPDFVVEKAPEEQQLDAKSAGENEDYKTKEELAALKKKQHDQLVRARIRGNEALKKEKLKHEYDSLMADLSLLQKADRRRRQVIVSKLPKQVFLPPDRRMEEMEDKQMEMERKFEDMYMQGLDISGNLSLTLDAKPMPETPVGTGDATPASEASPTVLPNLPPINPALRELTNLSRSQGQPVPQGKPETVLKKLLNRIKEQRSEVEAERSQQANVSSDVKGFKPQQSRVTSSRGRASAKGQRPPSPVEPDPELDLSPLRAAGNLKPQRHEAQREELTDEVSTMDGDSEMCFLDHLKNRLEALDAQKEYLDHRMKEHQAKHQQEQQQRYRIAASARASQPFQPPSGHMETLTRTDPPPAAPVMLQTADLVRERDRAMNMQREAPASVSSSVPYSLSQPVPETGRQVGGVAMTTGSKTNLIGRVDRSGDGVPLSFAGGDFARAGREQGLAGISGAQTMTVPAAGMSYGQAVRPDGSQPLGFSQPASGLGYTSTGQLSASVGYPHMATGDGQYPGGYKPADPAQSYPGLGMGVGSLQGGVPSSIGVSGVGATAGGLGQPTSTGGARYFGPAVTQAGAAVPPSRPLADVPLSTADLAPSSGPTVPPGVTAAHPHASSQPLSSMTSQLAGRQFQPLSTTLSTSQLGRSAGAGFAPADAEGLSRLASSIQQAGAAAERAEMMYSSLAARLASGLSEQDRLKHVRDYQRHLVEKHEQRMKALAETRARIENRQADVASQPLSQSLLSTSGRGVTDPATLVPYTLRTSALQAESTSFSGAAVRSAVPAGGDGYKEPILAGSAAMRVAGDSQWNQLSHMAQSGLFSTAAADYGDRGRVLTAPTLPATTTNQNNNRLDTVRKSLPFDNPDETLHREDAEGEAGDLDRISMADDSHISSSTDRGSPALGSRSGSCVSGSLGSGMSDGSIGGSSLVARAEEKRISFEQRQRELQDQLAEIQRQKDLLLQRYHGNQERVTAQEDTVRGKLRAAQAAAGPSSTGGSLATSAFPRPQPAGSAGAFGPASERLPLISPSMELEERSISSEQLSQRGGARSWAVELEEYSISQDKAGERSNRTPGELTLEEISIMSEREWSIGKQTSGERSGEKDQRPTSSLSSLQEVSITSGNGLHSPRSLSVEELSSFGVPAAGNQDSSATVTAAPGIGSLAVGTSGLGKETSVMSSGVIESMLKELGRAGNVGGGAAWSGILTSAQSSQQEPSTNNSGADNFSRFPPPPTRQPVPVTEYEPHELSTILEVDTPQTGTKTVTATGPEAASEKSGARRFIDFGKHGTGTALDDDRTSESKFSASGSSASSDVRSVIEVVRPGVLKMAVARAGIETNRDQPGLAEKGDYHMATSGFMSLQQLEGQSLAGPKPNVSGFSSLPGDGDQFPGSQDTTASSARGFQPLDLTLGSLTSRSLSMEDSRARRFLDFSGSGGEAGGAGKSGEGGGESGSRGQEVDEVLKKARQFNQDLLSAIQRQSADAFDQSSVSAVSHGTADASQESGL